MRKSYLCLSQQLGLCLFLFLCWTCVFASFATLAVEKSKNKETKDKVITVPDDYRTIQKAVDAAKSGDKVRVREGIYKETVTMKDGITLIGQSAEKVIIQQDALTESVLLVKDCKAGNISDITFEQTGTSDEENRHYVVAIINSSIILKDCVIKNGVGCRLGIEGTSSPEIKGCTITSNGWTGISIYGKDAKALLKSNRIENNREYGISFRQGTCGSAEANRVHNNGWSGISIGNEDSSPSIKKNTCTANKRTGLSACGSGTKPSIRRNKCNNNLQSGFAIFEGADPKWFNDNSAEGNGQKDYNFE